MFWVIEYLIAYIFVRMFSGRFSKIMEKLHNTMPQTDKRNPTHPVAMQ